MTMCDREFENSADGRVVVVEGSLFCALGELLSLADDPEGRGLISPCAIHDAREMLALIDRKIATE